MRTSQPLVRTPNEMMCPMLQIADGCTYGKCRFCGIYRNYPFRLYSNDEVVRNIEEIARTATATTHRIYLAGGNPFGLPTKRLVEVFDEVEKRIPQVNSYGGFCRVLDVKNKSDEELALLASRGVNSLDIGAESGLDSVLEFIEKGTLPPTSSSKVNACTRWESISRTSTWPAWRAPGVASRTPSLPPRLSARRRPTQP